MAGGGEAMEVDASAAPLPNTPPQEPAAMPAAGLNGGASLGTTGQPSSSGTQQLPQQQQPQRLPSTEELLSMMHAV